MPPLSNWTIQRFRDKMPWLVVAVVSFGSLIYGGQNTWVGFHNRRPRVVSFAQFARALPGTGWYRITGTVLDVPGSVTRHSDRGDMDGIYVPVYDASDTRRDRIVLLLSTTDADIGAATVPLARPAEGMVERGLDGADALTADVRGLTALAPGYRVLDDGFTPHPWGFLVLFLFGLVSSLGYVGLVGRAISRRTWAWRHPGVPLPPEPDDAADVKRMLHQAIVDGEAKYDAEHPDGGAGKPGRRGDKGRGG